MNRFLITISLIFINTIYISANSGFTKKLIPDHVNIQFAGNIGLISAGTGYKLFNEIWQTDILLGYVPESVAEADIFTIAWKNNFRLIKYQIKNKTLSLNTAFSVNLETGNNSYLVPSKKFPKDYYGTNSLTYGLYLGGRINIPLKSKILSSVDIGVEVCTLASYAYYNIIAEDERYSDIYSISFHTNLNF